MREAIIFISAFITMNNITRAQYITPTEFKGFNFGIYAVENKSRKE